MKQKSIYLLFLLCLSITLGKRYLNINGIHLGYTFLTKHICHSEDNRFFLQPGLAFEQCIKECAVRPHCLELNYRRKTQLCELFSTVDDDKQMEGGCVRVFACDIEMIQKPKDCDECVYGETCEVYENGTGKCLVKECVNSTQVTNGYIQGNMKDVGSKVQFKCEAGYRERDGITTGVCLDTGHWNVSVVNCVEEGNVAKNKSANQSSTEDEKYAKYATDGNWVSDNGCSQTAKNQPEGWWEVNLGKKYPVKRVTVHTRKSEHGSKFNNISVTIGDTQEPTERCTTYFKPEPAPGGKDVDLTCDQIINGQYVRISKIYNDTNDILAICEVGVYLW